MVRFIVAEISKNWQGHHATTGRDSRNSLLALKFEEVIDVNCRRGYRLHSFQLHRIMTAPDCLNETIIAVFEKE